MSDEALIGSGNATWVASPNRALFIVSFIRRFDYNNSVSLPTGAITRYSSLGGSGCSPVDRPPAEAYPDHRGRVLRSTAIGDDGYTISSFSYIDLSPGGSHGRRKHRYP